MNVAYVVDWFPELSETWVTGELRELRALGHDVRVEFGAHAARPDPSAAAGIEAHCMCDDTLGERVRSLLWLVARHPLRCARDLAARRRWRREEDVRGLRTLAPAVRRVHRSGARHLHAHFAAGAALDALRTGALLGLPYSVMTHGYDLFSEPRNLREKHERAAFALTPCDYSARYLSERHGVTARKLIVGVDPARFRRSAPAPGGRTVVAVGRLVEKKGLEYLVEAAARARVDKLVIVGDGPLRDDLEARIAALGAGDRVELAGERSPAAVRDALEQADVLAAPCVIAANGDRDTMPVVVKEALAMEVPVVATDEVGLPELVRPEWGRLVPPRDADALAAALDELLDLPPADRAAMGRAGRAWVADHCDLASETARLARMFEEAAE